MPTFAPDFGQQTIPQSDVLGYFMSALGSKKRKEAKEKTIRIVCFNFLKKIIYFINLKKSILMVKKSILMETISDVIDKKLQKAIMLAYRERFNRFKKAG